MSPKEIAEDLAVRGLLGQGRSDQRAQVEAAIDAATKPLREEIEALRAQFKSVGIVPYLDRMAELANRVDQCRAENERLRAQIAAFEEGEALWAAEFDKDDDPHAANTAMQRRRADQAEAEVARLKAEVDRLRSLRGV